MLTAGFLPDEFRVHPSRRPPFRCFPFGKASAKLRPIKTTDTCRNKFQPHQYTTSKRISCWLSLSSDSLLLRISSSNSRQRAILFIPKTVLRRQQFSPQVPNVIAIVRAIEQRSHRIMDTQSSPTFNISISRLPSSQFSIILTLSRTSAVVSRTSFSKTINNQHSTWLNLHDPSQSRFLPCLEPSPTPHLSTASQPSL